MELSDLVGLHTLSGVETGYTVVHDEWEGNQDCQFVKFTLDGVHYMAVEDPDDGYRSRCRDLVVSDTPPRYSFPPQSMRCFMKRAGDDGCNNDIIVMQDIKTKEIVLEVGTGDYDDWYPYCHFVYNPEGMACNNSEISEEAFNRIVRSQSGLRS